MNLNLEVIFLPGLYLRSGMSIKLTLSKDGKKIYGYKDSNLFLAPYSVPFKGKISKKDLIEQTLINSVKMPDSLSYEFRLAYDFKRRLKEWRITYL